MLSGASGQFYGNKYTWQLLTGWPRHLDTIGSRQLTFVTNLFSRRHWFDLVPTASTNSWCRGTAPTQTATISTTQTTSPGLARSTAAW
jgi:hypothetical protein